MDEESKEKITLREVMNAPVIYVEERDTVTQAARKMSTHRIGGVVVFNESSRPVGIVTERDIIARCIAHGKNPETTKVSEIMSSPLITLSENTDIRKALDLMRLRGIRRIGVTRNDRLVGMVSDRDLLEVMPGLYELLVEKASAEQAPSSTGFLEGFCDECNQWSDRLTEVDGRVLCEDCRADMGV